MKTKFFFINFIIIALLTAGTAVPAGKIFAQEIGGLANIQYPVEELGNCQNETACKLYCDKPENTGTCLSFAKKNNLMSEQEIAVAEKFLEAGGIGPGGCQTKDACETYCNEISHINECISFAEENGLIPPEELEEAKKVQAAIANGIMPPACGNKKACDIYCEEPSHMEECVSFAEAAGFIQGKELEDAKKMLAAVKKGVMPPPCRGKEECDEYCGAPDNMEQCMTFALEAGFMSEQEKTDAQKMLRALKKGVKPPNCQGKEECDVYCSQDEHFKECLNFAEAAGFISPEDAAMSRKTGGKGPGGCKGKEECEAFCNNPDNQEICFNFAKENGLIPEEDLRQMEEGKQKFRESLEQAPAPVIECLISQVGSEMAEKFKSGAAMPSREIGDQIRQCFEKMMPLPEPGAPGEGGLMPPAGQTGPGGCQTPEECRSYCQANQEECRSAPAPNMPVGPEGLAPGEQEFQLPAGTGCQTPEECRQMPMPPQGEIIQPMPMPQEGGMAPEQMMVPPPEFSGEGGESSAPTPYMPSQEQMQFSPSPDSAPVPAPEFAPAPDPMPAPESAPQSFLKIMNLFLGNIINFLR